MNGPQMDNIRDKDKDRRYLLAKISVNEVFNLHQKQEFPLHQQRFGLNQKEGPSFSNINNSKCLHFDLL